MVIGLAGYIGVGKSTAAKKLCEHIIQVSDKPACTWGFGAELRSEIIDFIEEPSSFCIHQNEYPKDVEVLHGLLTLLQIPSMIHYKPTQNDIRKLLQWWGTEFRRNQDPNYWVKRWSNRMYETELSTSIVVDDVRFKNEYEAVINQPDSIVVMLNRDGVERQSNHSSEDFSWFTKDLPKTIEYTLTEEDLESGEYLYNAIQEAINRY